MSELAMRDAKRASIAPREPTEPEPAAAARAKAAGWKRWIKPVIAMAVIALAAFLLYRTLSNYSYDQIADSLAAIPGWRFAMAILCAAGSYLCLTGFDWLAPRYIGQNLPYPYVALTSFCSLSLGHNIGFAALSSGAVRYRFYSRWGLNAEEVAKVIVFCGATVGLGLMVLAEVALLFSPQLAGAVTGLTRSTLTGLGVA